MHFNVLEQNDSNEVKRNENCIVQGVRMHEPATVPKVPTGAPVLKHTVPNGPCINLMIIKQYVRNYNLTTFIGNTL